jgi:hypothetical protein
LKINALEERSVNNRVGCVENELRGNPREGLECETKRKKSKNKMGTTDQGRCHTQRRRSNSR